MEGEAVPDTSTVGILKFVENHYIFRHGAPERLISDQGPGFVSKQMAEKVALWRIEHSFATPEHPQANGLVERVNRTLSLVLPANVNDDYASWEDHLSAAVFAINTAR